MREWIYEFFPSSKGLGKRVKENPARGMISKSSSSFWEYYYLFIRLSASTLIRWSWYLTLQQTEKEAEDKAEEIEAEVGTAVRSWSQRQLKSSREIIGGSTAKTRPEQWQYSLKPFAFCFLVRFSSFILSCWWLTEKRRITKIWILNLYKKQHSKEKCNIYDHNNSDPEETGEEVVSGKWRKNNRKAIQRANDSSVSQPARQQIQSSIA